VTKRFKHKLFIRWHGFSRFLGYETVAITFCFKDSGQWLVVQRDLHLTLGQSPLSNIRGSSTIERCDKRSWSSHKSTFRPRRESSYFHCVAAWLLFVLWHHGFRIAQKLLKDCSRAEKKILFGVYLAEATEALRCWWRWESDSHLWREQESSCSGVPLLCQRFLGCLKISGKLK